MVNEENKNNIIPKSKVILTDEAKKKFDEREILISDLQDQIDKMKKQADEYFKGAVWVEGHPDYCSPCYYACKYLDKENYLYCTVDKEKRKCGDLIIKNNRVGCNCEYCNTDRVDEYFNNFYKKYFDLKSKLNKI